MTQHVYCNTFTEMVHNLIDSLDRNMGNSYWEVDESNDIYKLDDKLSAYSTDADIIFFFECGLLPIPMDRLKIAESKLKEINITIRDEPESVLREEDVHPENYVLRKFTNFKREVPDYVKIVPFKYRKPTEEEMRRSQKTFDEFKKLTKKQMEERVYGKSSRYLRYKETYGEWIAAIRHNGVAENNYDEFMMHPLNSRDREIERMSRIVFDDALDMNLNW